MSAHDDDRPEALAEVAAALLAAMRAANAPGKVVVGVAGALDEWLPEVPEEARQKALARIGRALPPQLTEDAFAGYVRLTGRLTSVEAHILHSALQAQGLKVRLAHDHLAAAELPNAPTGVELWVHLDQREQALEAVASLSASSGEARKCSGCGEESPANFTSCWGCGADLGA